MSLWASWAIVSGRAAGVFTRSVDAALVLPLTDASGVTAAAGSGASTGPAGALAGGTGGGIAAGWGVRGFRGALFRVGGTGGVVSLVAGSAGTVGRFFSGIYLLREKLLAENTQCNTRRGSAGHLPSPRRSRPG